MRLSLRVQGLNLFDRKKFGGAQSKKEKKKKEREKGDVQYTFARVDPDPGVRGFRIKRLITVSTDSSSVGARFHAARLTICR